MGRLHAGPDSCLTHIEKNEPKIVLLVRLLNAIDDGRFSFDSLKERIAEGERLPSTRTLRRYLAILGDAGFPWYFDRAANRYRFADGYSLKRLELSGSELFGLVALRSLGASLGGSIGAYVDDVTAKLIGSTGNSVRERMKLPSPVAFRLSEIRLDKQGEMAFSLLSSAERSSRSVSFTYHDKDRKKTKRTVDPYGFVVSAGRVYVVGYDHTRHEKRVFAVDNVSAATILANTYVKPADFNVEEFASQSISGVLHSNGTTEVQVRFNARVSKAAIAARVVAEQAIEKCGDGSAQITYRVADLDELLRWTLSWGDEAEIVSPQKARDRAAAILGRMHSKYDRSSLVNKRNSPK